MTTQRQLVALGGGGFSIGSDPRLDDYLLKLTGEPRPRDALAKADAPVVPEVIPLESVARVFTSGTSVHRAALAGLSA